MDRIHQSLGGVWIMGMDRRYRLWFQGMDRGLTY